MERGIDIHFINIICYIYFTLGFILIIVFYFFEIVNDIYYI